MAAAGAAGAGAGSLKAGKSPVAAAGRAAGTFVRKMREDVDVYDIILSHLLDEGYANSVENAEVIMVNMSEDWRNEILEAKVEAEKSPEEKKKIRTARSGFTGQYANYERRGAHRERDNRNKDLADLRKGKKKDSSYHSYLP